MSSNNVETLLTCILSKGIMPTGNNSIFCGAPTNVYKTMLSCSRRQNGQKTKFAVMYRAL